MKQRDILFLLVSVVAIVFAWIIFSVIHLTVTSTVSKAVSQEIAPIDPNFDTKTLNALKNRQQVQPTETSTSPTPTTTITPSPSVVTPTASASSGGILR